MTVRVHRPDLTDQLIKRDERIEKIKLCVDNVENSSLDKKESLKRIREFI